MYYVYYGNDPRDEIKIEVSSLNKAQKLVEKYKANYNFAYITDKDGNTVE